MIYTEKQRDIPVGGSFDVIVAGSGPAGMAAAVLAARGGAKVLLIEAQGSVGGIATTGLMSHFTGTADSAIYREFLHRAANKNPYNKGEFTNKIDPELLKNTFYEMIKEEHIELLLYTFCCGAIVENNRVCGVITESKSGRRVFFAKVIIDCTGDGDVAY